MCGCAHVCSCVCVCVCVCVCGDAPDEAHEEGRDVHAVRRGACDERALLPESSDDPSGPQQGTQRVADVQSSAGVAPQTGPELRRRQAEHGRHARVVDAEAARHEDEGSVYGFGRDVVKGLR
eukprot:1182605-Prorocentrum_minimum.AAC.5